MRTVMMYVKAHMKKVLLYLCFNGIFAVVFYLYELPLEAVGYAFLLSTVLLVLCGVIELSFFVRRHNALLEIEKRINIEWELMPRAADIIEADYQRMLEAVFEKKTDIESNALLSKQEMQDYYGLWTHQIKTPIAAMRVLLQSWEETEGEIETSYVKSLKIELFKIEQYVEMVLSYLRLEDISADLSFNWYPLEDMVRQVVRKYSQMFILRKIKLDMQSFEEMVLTDEKWLIFVLEQLLSNALKYTKQGTISIYMSMKQGQKCLVIEDTGMGIWKEDLPRIFEKGFTGYNGRVDKKSTGIGLYLCKTVMDKLNHSIQVESVVGVGTKVCLFLERTELHSE